MYGKPPILHLCHWDPKFIPQVIKFINSRFNPEDHRFLIYGDSVPAAEETGNQSVLGGSKLQIRCLLALRREMTLARRVIVHGLFNNRIAGLLASMPKKLPDCRWVLWGGDLYDWHRLPRNARWRLARVARMSLCARLGGIAALIPGDVETARAWLGFRGRHFNCLGYPSNVLQQPCMPAVQPGHLTVLVGNSATPSNRHFRVFDSLSATRRDDFRVLCPLSYGDPLYAREVEAAGIAAFGSRFSALRSFLGLSDYQRLLAEVTIAVFAHDRQQAVGNCIQLLGRGVRLHLDPQTSHFRYFRSAGFPVGSADAIDLEPLDPALRDRSLALAADLFSEAKLESQYRELFG
jgi:dTDP-N-acetylfucosamine:lipid II N-acetylfucosaminyltransferase